MKLDTTGCMGICSREPLVTVEVVNQEPIIYEYIDAGKAAEIFDTHIKDGTVVSKYAFARVENAIWRKGSKTMGIEGQEVIDDSIDGIEEIPYFSRQKQIVMRNRGYRSL